MSVSPNQWLIGDRPVVRGTFRDVDAALADPTSIEVVVREPDGTTTTYASPHASIVQDSTGVWDFTLPTAFDAAGKWYVYMVGAGGGADAAEQYVFDVRAPRMALA